MDWNTLGVGLGSTADLHAHCRRFGATRSNVLLEAHRLRRIWRERSAAMIGHPSALRKRREFAYAIRNLRAVAAML